MRIAVMMWWLAAAGAVLGQAPERVALWPDGAPGALGQLEADQPFMEVYRPRRVTTDIGLIVFPGGGYKNLALDHEGLQIAQWANAQGMTVFVARYRLLPKYAMPTPFEDGRRAVRLVRSLAGKYKVNPNRIGVMGFSAGGHLASMLSTHFDAGDATAADAVERQSCRPDFSILVYAAVNFDLVDQPAMLGTEPKAGMNEWISTDKHVKKDSPPAFLFHTDEDKADHSVAYYLGCRRAGVPAELHIYQLGRHGMGLATGHPVLGNWPGLALRWMAGLGLLDKVGR
jgi:acetyl esterase/lipase